MAANREHRRRRPRSLWLWIGYWVGMFVVMHVHAAVVPHAPIDVRHGDKVTHFGLYFLLVMLGGRHRLATGRRMSIAALLSWAAVYAAYAGVDEWLQQFVGRAASLADWLADLGGIVAATATLALRHR